ncbi:MAG: FAD-binding protein [Planctomycetaceae bacterium]|jgi:succinate dehydrogenase/fumarate reductase flavoprotein subunit|nr:FAD-binding protein [Planctomycetaceae bacterium]
MVNGVRRCPTLEGDLPKMQPTIFNVHTIILGSGAAGLNAALQLQRRGITDLLILTEGLTFGTSINAGSDKQTYYKLNLYGDGRDSVRDVAETLFNGGAADGDTAMVEAALSARAFYNLLELGVQFPQDAYGQFPGYKTDHDPRQRATSIGPYTSREMCHTLIAEVKRLQIHISEHRIAVRLLTVPTNENKQRIAGVFCINIDNPLETCLEFYLCENLIFATGGLGGLYRDSVYPRKHTGGIGLAMEIGARCQNLAESQFGLASTAFRWNVSGSYMQVMPRFISTDINGNDEREFLDTYYNQPSEKLNDVFLKGYQWPFDAGKICGSSLVDLLVYRETVECNRRVFLDYRTNSPQFDIRTLPNEPRKYLEQCEATHGTPIDRLEKMNPQAIKLYKTNGIDLHNNRLEIALCIQHNNGGVSVNRYWESVNIQHLFAVGEVAGTHGITRPGGAALNAGQVGGFRVAEWIAAKYNEKTLDSKVAIKAAEQLKEQLMNGAIDNIEDERGEFQARMSENVGAIVFPDKLSGAVEETRKQLRRLSNEKKIATSSKHLAESLRTRTLVYAAYVYTNAITENVEAGSRGSRIVVEETGNQIHPKLEIRYKPEQEQYRNIIKETQPPETHIKRSPRPLPVSGEWFEKVWANFQDWKHLD